jgi:pre-mRNA-splicing factor SPF27
MALTTTVHDSLPYIDTEPTPAERAAAQALIDAELPPSHKTTPHPSLPPPPEQHFSPYIESEILRITNKHPLNAIDRSRYEALEPPTTSPDSDSNSPESLVAWRAALSQAYTAHAYLTARTTNLHLLEEFGRNGWLIGNSQLEDELRALERELGERKAAIDGVVVERRGMQEGVGAEVKGLQEGWRRGVGRVLETEVAAEGIRREVLERRRDGAR